jgi:hypothetical protein
MPTKPDPESIDQDAPEADAVWFAKAKPAPEVLVALLGEATAEELLSPNRGSPPSSRKNPALDRLLAIAPTLEAAGVPPMSDEKISAEVQAARAERRSRQAAGKSADAAGS